MQTDNKMTKTDDFESSVNTRPATFNEVAYRDGYVSGQVNAQQQYENEENLREENLQIRENERATNGFLLGMFIVALFGLGVAAYFIFPSSNTSSSQELEPQPAPPKVEKETRIIEKTVDRVREVVPTTPPDVEITIPASEKPTATQPSPAQATAPQPTSVQPTATQPVAPQPPETQQPSPSPEAMVPLLEDQPTNETSSAPASTTGN